MTGVSTLGQALRQIENLNRQQVQLGTLSTQLATGKKTQSYAGLNVDALTSVRSRTALTSISVYINNIQRADTIMGLTVSAVEEFQQQTEEFSDTLVSFLHEGDHQIGDKVYYDDPATEEVETIIVGNTSGELDTDFGSVIQHSKNLFTFLGELLNTKEGDRFLFAGADGGTQPYNDTGTLEAAVGNLLTDWKSGAITTDELISDLFDRESTTANANAINDATIGYSSSLSNGTAGNVFVRASENSEFKYTALANEDSFRDIMVMLAVMSNEAFPPIVDVYEDGVYPGTPDQKGAPGATADEQKENFYDLFDQMARRVNESIDDIDEVRFRIESVRVQMNETLESHIDQRELLQNTVSEVEDVDTNEVAVRITTLKTQLEASYQVTALTQNLTLANFL